MIRILQVVTHMNRGGLETMLMNYYRHIDRDKMQFDFLVHRPYRADYDDEIESMGGRIYRIGKLVPWSGSYKKELRAFFAEHPEYRIIHVHQDCLSGVILKEAKAAGIPVRIAHSHNANQDKDLKYPIKLFYRRLIPEYSTDLFACGKDAGEWMFRNAPFRVLANAIDAAQYAPDEGKRIFARESLGIGRDTFIVGHVGSFTPHKNHLGLIDIFEAIHRKNPDSVLLLVGNDKRPLADRIKETVKEKGLDQCVIFTGVRSDVPDLLQAMDAFVFPSLYEGLPVTLIEAQSSGLRCFVSDRVSAECDVTGLIESISLESPAEKWAECVLAGDHGHTDTYEKIAAAGYDITENARWLRNFYEDKAK